MVGKPEDTLDNWAFSRPEVKCLELNKMRWQVQQDGADVYEHTGNKRTT